MMHTTPNGRRRLAGTPRPHLPLLLLLCILCCSATPLTPSGTLMSDWLKGAGQAAGGLLGGSEQSSEGALERSLGVTRDTDTLLSGLLGRGAAATAAGQLLGGTSKLRKAMPRPRRGADRPRASSAAGSAASGTQARRPPSLQQRQYLERQDRMMRALLTSNGDAAPASSRSADLLTTVGSEVEGALGVDIPGVGGGGDSVPEVSFTDDTRLGTSAFKVDFSRIAINGPVVGDTGRAYCDGGEQFYLMNATFRCPSHPGVVYPAEAVVGKENCVAIDLSAVRCVCPMDVEPRLVNGTMVCDKPLPLHCDVKVLAPSRSDCAPPRSPLDHLRACHMVRSTDKVRVRLLLTCGMRRIDDLRDIYTFINPDRDEVLVRSKDDTSFLYKGTLRDIQYSHFERKALPLKARFPGLSQWHWLLRKSFIFRLINYNRAGDFGYLDQRPVAEFGRGEITGEKTLDFDLDFSAIPQQYFQGGRVSVEAGFLFSGNHTRGVIFDFEDYSPRGRPEGEKKERNTIIVIATLAGVILLGALGFYAYTQDKVKSMKSE